MVDRPFGFVAVDVDDVPVDVRSLTTDWLTAVLCVGAPGAHVVGWGPTGVLDDAGRATIGVRYDVPGRVAGLPEDLVLRTGRSPQRLRSPWRTPTRLEVPTVHWVAVDDRSGRWVRLTEDVVATRGAVFAAEGSSVPTDRGDDVLVLLAEVHGASWRGAGGTVVHGRVRSDHVYVTADGTTGLSGWTAPAPGPWWRDVGPVLALVDDPGGWQVALAHYLDALSVAGGRPPAFVDAVAEVRRCAPSLIP